VWKGYFFDWIENANPQDLLEASIFFDFRHVHGDESIVRELQEQVRRATMGNHAFLLYLSQNALRFKPPVQALKSGDTVDMKAAMQAVVDYARVYALRHGIAERNTPRRLELLQQQGVLSPAGGRELAQAYAYMMRLRFRHQLALRKAHGVPNNSVPVPGLTEIDRVVLRRAFALIEDFQGKMNLDFKGTL
jgi:CBS domain-containing protein